MSTCVCVLSNSGERLMPTIRLGKVRHLLKDGKAKIVKHHPFTIQLLYDSKTNTQPIEICEDVGYNYIGISVKSESHEYVSAQYDTLQDEKKHHDDCRKYRRTHRNRLRYRKPRFDNRKRSEGWLAPSLEHNKALQKRSKKTKTNPKTGRAHSKKRFGKSIGRCAPALFITILGQKASRCGGSVIKVSTFETKASQFDHTDDSFTKKKLSQRFAKLSDGTVVQRDLYSAFLLLHLRKNLQSYNKKTIKKDFPQFKMLHDKTKERLQNSHKWLPCSVGF